VKPYALFTNVVQPGRGVKGDRDGNAGVDLFYNLTPSVRANLTINTDFAQTEVDQRQVNLTRFSLFFPERRDFFSMARRSSTLAAAPARATCSCNPFFSRRIGLAADATPQPIDVGTKITGQFGRQDIGVLHVRTGLAMTLRCSARTSPSRASSDACCSSRTSVRSTHAATRGTTRRRQSTPLGVDMRWRHRVFSGVRISRRQAGC
jgi:hypothetical protein